MKCNNENVSSKQQSNNEFTFGCHLLRSVNYNSNEGISYCKDVHPSTRERIIREGDFIPLSNIAHADLLNLGNQTLQTVKMNETGYGSCSMPPKHTPIKSKFELFKCLFLFAFFYLQAYPEKTVSFFNYLLNLMEQA